PGLGAPLDELAQPFNDQGVSIAGKRYAAGAGGLGLFIARRVLAAHGGRLVAESSGPRGTALLAYLGPACGPAARGRSACWWSTTARPSAWGSRWPCQPRASRWSGRRGPPARRGGSRARGRP